MGLEHGGNVGAHHRHGIAVPNPPLRERRCQTNAALVQFPVGVALVAMDHGGPVAEDPRGALQKAHRRERHEVCRRFGQVAFEYGCRPAHPSLLALVWTSTSNGRKSSAFRSQDGEAPIAPSTKAITAAA